MDNDQTRNGLTRRLSKDVSEKEFKLRRAMWNKLPAHRRKVLMLKWWREDTLSIDRDWFQHNMSPNDEGERLDDNNLDFPCK
jgi:hypothetical protein